jgi:hypothetical protein
MRVLFLLLAPPLLAQAPVVGNCTVFPADNVWNTPIDTLPVDPSSTTYVNTIGASLGLKADFGAGLWNGGPIGIPYVTVPGTQTKYPASFLYADESDPGPYAVPLNAPIEGGSQSDGDRHAISIDIDNCILYELYRAFPQTASWQADSGAIFNLNSHLLRPATWTSADAAGLPIFAGLVRYDEVLAGEIRHAIRFTVPQTRRAFIWPARHYASSLTGTQYPPMGQRFRLKASYNISGFSATNQVILRALQKYGMILADNGSAWYMTGVPDERWNNTDLNALRGVLGSNFEAVDESSLMIDPNSGQARQSGVTVTVSPAAANVLVGATRVFTAAVTGTTNQSVTWAVNGVNGGNSTVGWIDSTGSYQAPGAVPSPATVAVQARSVAEPTAVGSSAVTVVPPPSITSLSPSPLYVGSFTLTVNGSAFQSGAVVKFGGTNLATTFVSSIKLTATGTASSTSPGVNVIVTNPDGGVSNTASVAVVNPPVTVTVSPTSAAVKVRQSRQFTATVQNSANQAVTWKVNGIAGGNSTVGTITAAGLYTAPSSVPSPSTVQVSAQSQADPSASGNASVTIKKGR